MTTLDYIVLGGYFVFSALLGLWFLHRVAGKMQSLGDFFLSGRRMSWWLLGTSMAATTFAADTPIVAARVTAQYGLSFSWMFLPTVLTACLTTFFFARLWRRSAVLTDVEFLELRYPSRAGRILRGFKALYLGGLFNALIIGMQLIAIGEIGHHVLGINRDVTMLLGAALALLYSVLAGFTGVVITDFIQFVIALIGSLLLAVFALRMPEVGGLSGLAGQLGGGVTRAMGPEEVHVSLLALLPGPDTPFITIWILVVLLSVYWWSVVSGGMEPGGGGQVAQRMLAARSERHAAGASLWFSVVHFGLRVWPWLLVGLACVVLYPDMENFQEAYASAIRDTLPAGLRGLLVASFFAAFISTMDTRLNLGSAYLVNDFYRRFLAPSKPERHYVQAGRMVTVLLCVLPFAVPYVFQRDILGVLMFWLQVTAGTGLVYIVRWYWWRVNAWSEISAMIAALMYTFGFLAFKYDWNMSFYAQRPDMVLLDIPLITLLTTATWIPITYLTSAEPMAGLKQFFAAVRPGGPGWRAVANQFNSEERPHSPDNLTAAAVAWLASSVFLLSFFMGTGNALLLDAGAAIGYLSLSAVSLAVLLPALRKVFA
jgi:solute:Na+ symporter, SSS family